jgi:hypothetical protein
VKDNASETTAAASHSNSEKGSYFSDVDEEAISEKEFT